MEPVPPARGTSAGLAALTAALVSSLLTATFMRARLTPSSPPSPSSPVSISATAAVPPAQDAIVRAAREIGPSVVNIEIRSAAASRTAIEDGGLPSGQGSGVIVSSDGTILTNHHVVQGASQIEVTLPEPDGRRLQARLKGADPLSDVAILKVDADKLPAARLGDSDSTPIGAFVLAVGNPFGFQHTVTVGVLSGREREIPEPGKEFRNLLQTDAAINPGNSGGPLVDIDGRVIGINTVIITRGQGLGFAIPINTARDVMQQLLANGRVIRSYIGIIMMPVTPRLARDAGLPNGARGAVVRQVMRGSPAAGADIRAGDIIVGVDARPTSSITQVQSGIRAHRPGERVTLTIYREGHPLQTQLPVDEMPAHLPRP
ncbi:MAG: PDZ domain-containing protein [Proteobacteria bacterium]|nr:PDZ domain-containing protein [Pseudomonadota bacterium]